MTRIVELGPAAKCGEFLVEESDLYSSPKDELVCMAFLLHLIRQFETKVLELKDADLVHGPVHTSIGQEAVAAGVARALRKTDLIGSTHRAHGHFLAKALSYYAPDGFSPLGQPLSREMQQAVYRTLAEIMGLRDGWCGGRGGSMHLYDGESGNLGSNGIVGGSIPLATGAAWAEKMLGQDKVVVSFFGDGAINQGCLHEVANMASLWHVPIIYLVENNQYAVGTPASQSSSVQPLALRAMGWGIDSLVVDGMDPLAVYLAISQAVRTMRLAPHPILVEAVTYRLMHHAGSLPGSAFGYRTREEEAEWKARDPVEVFPATLGRALVLSAEENNRLLDMARASVAEAESRCTEVKEGKRFIPTAKWPTPETVLEGVRSSGEELKEVRFVERNDFQAWRTLKYVEAMAAAIGRAVERDERVFVLGEEVGNLRGGAYGATRGIKAKFPDRLINTPISETGFVGLAGGAAMMGLRPIVEIMFPDFALMASDQLFNQIGKLRHMYGNRVHFPLVLRTRVAMGYGYGGQHSMDPCGYFSLFPGWRAVAPSNAFDYIGLLNTAVRLEDPVLVVEHGLLYDREDQVPEEDLDYCVAYGKANVLREGQDVTVLTYSLFVSECLAIAMALAEEGIQAEVIDLRTVDYIGMDYETIGRSVRKTGSAIIVEQAPRSHGLGGRLADEIQARFFDYLDGPVSHVAAPDVPLPVSKRLEDWVLPSAETIRAGIVRAARRLP